VKVADVELNIHFVALFSEKPGAIPVALFHGWPGKLDGSCLKFMRSTSNLNTGSFLEFLPILSLMKEKYTPQTLPYHLIVPSLPGYAFSDTPPLDREFDVRDISNFMNQLMIDLGFESGYIAQGGDIGSRVSRTLGIEHAACKGLSPNSSPLY
jgi:pimeloyl-ACP methyl ester carboxylesterase